MLQIIAGVVRGWPDDGVALTFEGTQSAVDQTGHALHAELVGQLNSGMYRCVRGNAVELQ